MRQLISHQRKNQMALIGVLFTTALAYQNFDFADHWTVKTLPFNESIRVDHAQELLGSAYKGSSAQKVEQQPDLGMAIFSDVYRNLPLSHKGFAIDLSRTIVTESEKYKLDPVFVLAVIKTESGFNPLAKGSHGEIGLMQIKPKTAEWISKRMGKRWTGAKSLENPVINVRISMAYFNYLRKHFNRDAAKYIAAYNMGVTNVNRSFLKGIKPKDYSSRILANYRKTYRFIATSGSGFPFIASN